MRPGRLLLLKALQGFPCHCRSVRPRRFPTLSAPRPRYLPRSTRPFSTCGVFGRPSAHSLLALPENRDKCGTLHLPAAPETPRGSGRRDPLAARQSAARPERESRLLPVSVGFFPDAGTLPPREFPR